MTHRLLGAAPAGEAAPGIQTKGSIATRPGARTRPGLARCLPRLRSSLVLTVVSIPKPYEGDTGRQQRCALASWAALGAKIFLIGDEDGVGKAAEQFGASHINGVVRNSRGTPFLDAAFRSVEEEAPDGIWCFVNADIVFTDDLLAAVGAMRREEQFLLVGQSRTSRSQSLTWPIRPRSGAVRSKTAVSEARRRLIGSSSRRLSSMTCPHSLSVARHSTTG